ncbi:DUF2142 domain-containing protein [Nocardia miyunensis]|uniref:DUF2142 domain-containing protein n=1 Tax=Nocardia miyunensis TaxID=282684 RepID=UPI001FE22B4A|nr:DUF2142 domain-containing protein [Nocardia miyunensis]
MSRASAMLGRVRRHLGPGALAFVLIAAVFGAVFTVVTPPFWGHDELTQFGRAYQVAHGGFEPQRITDSRGVAYGGQIPVSVDAMMNYAFKDYNRKPPEPAPLSAGRAQYNRLGDAPVSSATKEMWFTNTAAYSPVPYLPAAAGLRIAEATGLNVGQTVMLTRLAGLLAYLVLVGFGLRALRGYRVQWLAFTVSVLPIALFQAGTVTADTITNALAVLVSCLVVKGLFLNARLSRGEVVAALIATIALPLSKPTYVLLAMLVALIPARQYGFRRALRWIPWFFAILGAALFAAWMKIAAPTGDGMGLMRPRAQWYSVRTGDQLQFILGHPWQFTQIFYHSVWLRDQHWFTQFFGELGFSYVEVPALSVLACLLAFAVSAGIAERMSAAHPRTAIVALVVVASVAMIYVTLYMSFSPVGYYLVDGVQGRYFVPLAIVGLAVLLRWMPLRLSDSAGRTPARGPAVVIVVATIVALVAAVLKYHFMVWG